MENNNHVYETCVLCNAITDIPIITPVECREDFILGIGQLCIDCAEEYTSDNVEYRGY